jgi:replicative DNA helicase
MTTEKTTALTLKPVSEYLPQLKEILQGRGQKPEMPITSLPDLNNKLWGIKRKKMTLIAARPSVGKSAFALQLAYDLALGLKRVLFLSLEMTVEDMLERLFCYEHKIDNQDLMRGKYSQYADKFDQFCREIGKLKFVFSDCIGKSWQEVDEILKTLDPRPDVIVIDHINAIRVTGNAKTAIDDYITNMVEIAKHQNVAVILCCQINRDNQKDDDKTPQLHELKGSGNLEEAADIVLLLHWPHKYAKEGNDINKNHYMVIVGKNRNGPTGFINLHFTPEHYTFRDAGYEPPKFDYGLHRRDIDE